MKAAIIGFAPSFRAGFDSATREVETAPVRSFRSVRPVLQLNRAEVRLFHAWRP